MVKQFAEVNRIAKIAVKLVDEHFRVKAAYLFGSYVQGAPREDSDIDIAIFCEGIEKLEIDMLMNFIVKIQKEIGETVELHLFPASKLNDLRPSNFVGHITSHGMKIAA